MTQEGNRLQAVDSQKRGGWQHPMLAGGAPRDRLCARQKPFFGCLCARPRQTFLLRPASVLRALEAQGIGSVWTRAPLKTFWFDGGGHDRPFGSGVLG